MHRELVSSGREQGAPSQSKSHNNRVGACLDVADGRVVLSKQRATVRAAALDARVAACQAVGHILLADSDLSTSGRGETLVPGSAAIAAENRCLAVTHLSRLPA